VALRYEKTREEMTAEEKEKEQYQLFETSQYNLNYAHIERPELSSSSADAARD
jgi:hypothetical protein